MSSTTLRTFANDPFFSTPTDWTRDVLEPNFQSWTSTTNLARTDLIECQDCYCVYFGIFSNVFINSHLIIVDAPGVNDEDVDISVVNGILDVKMNRKPPQERIVGIHHRAERRFAERHRRLRLPENADGDHPVASLNNGVLTITFPKLGESLVKKIPIVQL